MDTSFDPTLANDIKQLLTEVPPPVREVFVSGKVETVTKSLMVKNRLHIDQAAIVERELILLLLGLKNPAEFTQTLATEAKLDQKTIDSISQDVNDQIFIPIRTQMRTGVAAAPQQTGTMAPPPQSPRYFHLENKIPPPAYGPRPPSSRVAPLPPKNILPRPVGAATPPGERSPLRDALAAAMKTPPPKVTENAPKPKLLEDHEEPHIEIPEVRPLSIASKVEPRIPPPVPPRPPAPITPAPPKSYSADPYREPIV